VGSESRGMDAERGKERAGALDHARKLLKSAGRYVEGQYAGHRRKKTRPIFDELLRAGQIDGQANVFFFEALPVQDDCCRFTGRAWVRRQ